MRTAIDAGSLLDEAREATGLSDFGPDDFREGLDVLIRTFDENPFHEEGRVRIRGRLLMSLMTRLRVEEAFRRHPEIRDREIVRPMFLTGLPRSGTSALFNLLAVDPDARPLLLWESQFPDPCWNAVPGEEDPRHAMLVEHFRREREQNPEFTKIHYADADTPEECVLLHAIAFDGGQTGYELMLEPYATWFHEHDLRPCYRYYADLLRLLDWQRPGRRWLLKTPAHLWAQDVLVELFPDCRIVWNHRDPAACIPSIASLIHTILAGLMDVASESFGGAVLDHYARSMDRGLVHRDALPPQRLADVDYHALVADNMGSVEKIYAHFGMPLEPGTREAMQAYIEHHPKDKHGKHDYSLERFGLTREQVRSRFTDYCEHFGV